jgi:GNAT superfamily N-acetyltransferase
VTICVRPARVDDVDTITRIYREASLSNERDVDELLAHPEYLVWSAGQLDVADVVVACEPSGAVVGFAATMPAAGSTAELEDLFVDPLWMRRGVARELIASIVREARQRRVRAITVTANPDALAFYEHAGFTDEGETGTQFGPGRRMRLDTRDVEAGPAPDGGRPGG